MNPKLLDRIVELFGDKAGDWCMAPNQQLDGRCPNQAVLEGDEAKVETIIDQLESGAFV